jgi:hypothetical protein
MKIMTLLHHQSKPQLQRSVAKMKPTTSTRTRGRRFLTDRYAYRERPNYLVELVAFGVIAITAIVSLTQAMATLR